jgi:hypothetical protein
VRQLLAEIDSAELSEWLAFDRIEPLPDSYWQAGMVAATVANVMGSGKGRRRRPEDFMPRRKGARREQPAAEGMAILDALMARAGGG